MSTSCYESDDWQEPKEKTFDRSGCNIMSCHDSILDGKDKRNEKELIICKESYVQSFMLRFQELLNRDPTTNINDNKGYESYNKILRNDLERQEEYSREENKGQEGLYQ